MNKDHIIYVKAEVKLASADGAAYSLAGPTIIHGECPGLPGFHRRVSRALGKLLGVPTPGKKPIRSAQVRPWQ